MAASDVYKRQGLPDEVEMPKPKVPPRGNAEARCCVSRSNGLVVSRFSRDQLWGRRPSRPPAVETSAQ